MTSEKAEIVYLIDSSQYFYRAYFAIRNLTNSEGFPTNAIYGFTKMILKLLSDKKPKYISTVFDSPGPNFRHEIFSEYKANRPPMPDDLLKQLPIIKAILKDMDIKRIEKQGYEADDIIGTLARAFQEKGLRVVIISSDKDFRQLLSTEIMILDTMKDKMTDYTSAQAEYGFEPEKFIDVMGLSGDTADNIPGVPGIGEKTAIKLIKEYGSFEEVFEQLERIKGKKLKENLYNFRAQAYLSKELVTINRFVPMEIDLKEFEIGLMNRNGLAKIFREYEFTELWQQFTLNEKVETDYQICLTQDALQLIIDRIKKTGFVAIDTETTSKDPIQAKLVGISFACSNNKAFYLPIGHLCQDSPHQLEWQVASGMLRDVLEDETIRKFGQNLKYDAEVLINHSIKLRGIHFDTMIASYVINPGLRQHNLDHLAQIYLNHKMINYQDVVGKGKKAVSFSEVPLPQATAYACEDADITFQLRKILEEKLKADKSEDLFYVLEMPLLPVLMAMEMNGIKIDVTFFKDLSQTYAKKITSLKKEIYEEAGIKFNINSPKQLGEIIFDRLGLPIQKRTKKSKNYSTDVSVLKKLSALNFNFPKLVLQYRTFVKLKSTYLDAMIDLVNPKTGRLHTSYNQTVVATGRLSSSNPNLQNIPIRTSAGREIRKGFVADQGHVLVAADYSQVELRVFAHYSQDENFIKAFKQNEDIHTRTATEILSGDGQTVTFEMRRIAKAINFGIIYGMGPYKLRDELNIDLNTAKDYIKSYYQKYHGVARFRDKMIEMARNHGYVTTLFNRRRYLPDINHRNQRLRAEAERMAVNTPIQGTAADLIKKAMISIYNRILSEGLKTRMLLQVHDELVFEVPEYEVITIFPLIKEEMEGVHELLVPLKVDIKQGKNWDEAH